MASLRRSGLLTVAVLIGGSVFGIGLFQPPTHALEGVAVSSAADEPTQIDIQVHAEGGDRLVVNRTVDVPARTTDLTPQGDGVQTGFSMAGQTTVSSGWENPGEYVVRARLTGAESWSRLDLGAVDRANDPPSWQSLLLRYRIEDRECFGVRVWVDETADTGVKISDTGCTVISG